MDLQARLEADLIVATKARSEPQRTVLRSLLAAVKNQQIADGRPLDDTALTRLLQKQLKQREESAAAYVTRPDLAAAEAAEAEIIRGYLPEPLSDHQLYELVAACISEARASGPGDIGPVMKLLAPQVAGRAEGSRVAQVVKDQLQGN